MNWNLRRLRNPISFIGLLIALLSGGLHLALLLRHRHAGSENPYVDIAFYVILPPIVVTGLVVALLGARYQKKIPKEGMASVWVAIALTLACVIPFVLFTSRGGYQYLSSTTFCGEACHTPMQPVFVSHQQCGHRETSCADCHIGSSVADQVKAKLNGTRQLISNITSSFPRPIRVPRDALPSLNDTCLSCHELSGIPDIVDKRRIYYSRDEGQTRTELLMRLFVSKGSSETSHGAHWHASTDRMVEFTRSPDGEIPWVKVSDHGTTTVFRSDGLEGDSPPLGDTVTMDCLSCHHRTGHDFISPDEAISALLESGEIDRNIPRIKYEATRLMERVYGDQGHAHAEIKAGLEEAYVSNKFKDFDPTVQRILRLFDETVFVDMRTDWRSHPSDRGHQHSQGCFQCHNGQHVSEDGKTISSDCRSCHQFLRESKEGTLAEFEFEHRTAFDPLHAQLSCDSCHAQGPSPPSSCAECHEPIARFLRGDAKLWLGENFAAEPNHGDFECIDCHSDPEPMTPQVMEQMCIMCHDEKGGELFQASRERIEAIKTSPEVFERLHKLGPFHNVDYAVKIGSAQGLPMDH